MIRKTGKRRANTAGIPMELLQQRVADNSPEKLLSRGYSITLKDGKAVTDASLLQPGDQLTTRLLKGEVQSTVR